MQPVDTTPAFFHISKIAGVVITNQTGLTLVTILLGDVFWLEERNLYRISVQ